MSLGAQFPRKSSSTCKTYDGEGASLVVKETQVHIVEPEENTEWEVESLNQSFMTRVQLQLTLLNTFWRKGSCQQQ